MWVVWKRRSGNARLALPLLAMRREPAPQWGVALKGQRFRNKVKVYASTRPCAGGWPKKSFSMRRHRLVNSAIAPASLPEIALVYFRSGKTKTSLTEIELCQGRVKSIRGATLIHGSPRALCGIPAYPRQMTSASNVAAYSGMPRFPAPSAVHLMICVSPDSHQRGLSVDARSPLSPLQRFSILNLIVLYYWVDGLSIGNLNFCGHSVPQCPQCSQSGKTPGSYSMPFLS